MYDHADQQEEGVNNHEGNEDVEVDNQDFPPDPPGFEDVNSTEIEDSDEATENTSPGASGEDNLDSEVELQTVSSEVENINDLEEDIDLAVDLQDRALNPTNLPNVGDRIVFWDPDSQARIKALIIPMHGNIQHQWPGWRNIINEDTDHELSVNLDPISTGCVTWKYITQIPQVDGNYTEENLSSRNTLYEQLTVTVPNDYRGDFAQNDTNEVRGVDLNIPMNSNLVPNRVYRLDEEPRHIESHVRSRRQPLPKFVMKLNPFKKK